MPYLHISDFRIGMDRRRPQTVGVPGTLWTLKNAFISRGGDIVRAKKFDSTYTLPADTFGFYSLKGQLFVFGSAAAPAVPTGIRYQQLAAPNTPDMIDVLDVRASDGQLYVIAEYDDGHVYHFYNGSRVTDWDTVAASLGSFNRVAEYLARKIGASASVSARAFGATIQVTAKTAGTAFTLTTNTNDPSTDSTPTAVATQTQANVAAVAETRATGTVEVTGGSSGPGTNRISSVTVDGTELLTSPVNWVTSNAATALALSNAINNNAATSGYTASVVDAVVTIHAEAGTGATPNGDVVAVTTGGSVTVVFADMSGGVTEVEAVAQVYEVVIAGGSFDSEDRWDVTVDGTTYSATGLAAGTGTTAFVHKKRMWSPVGSIRQYSKLNDPTDWTDSTASTGAGFINIASDAEGAQEQTAMGVYQGNAAFFAEEEIVIYALDTDSDNFAYVETIGNTGTLAPRSPVSFGNTDLFYLDAGVRSLRAHNGTTAAYKSDVGEPMDDFFADLLVEVGDYAKSRAQAVIDSREARYLLKIGRYVVALSYYPDAKIRAWSYVDFETDIDAIVRAGRDVYIRAGDTVYRYGGATGEIYPDADEFEAVAETPFMDARDPAARKMLEGFDMACSGTWLVEVLCDPNDLSTALQIGRIDKNTYHLPAIKLPGHISHVAFRFTCSVAGDASLSSLAIHYEKIKAG